MEFSQIEKLSIIKDVLSDSGVVVDIMNESEIIDQDNFDEVSKRQYFVLTIEMDTFEYFDISWFKYRCDQEGISYEYHEYEDENMFMITIHDIRKEDRMSEEDIFNKYNEEHNIRFE